MVINLLSYTFFNNYYLIYLLTFSYISFFVKASQITKTNESINIFAKQIVFELLTTFYLQ